MLNACIFQGRIASDPTYKMNEKAKVSKFRLAVQRDYKDRNGNLKADYINCSAFGKNAEVVDRYCQKGQMIIVKGAFQNGTPYDDSQGIRRFPSFSNIEKIYFVDHGNLKKPQEVEEEEPTLVQMGDIPF
jgi:single-strand DNA-binding protein